MASTPKIRQGMEVLGSCGGYVGKVDKVEGRSIRLAHEDPAGGGEYHFLPSSWVQTINQSVHLDRPVDAVMEAWGTGSANG